MIRRVVHLPYAMIQRRLNARSYKLEAFLVVLIGALGAPGWAYVAYYQLEAISEAPFQDAEMGFAMLGNTIEPLVFVVIVWFWYALASHFLSLHFKGRGPIGRLIRATAWTLVPIGIWYLIRSIVMIASFWGYDFVADPDGLETSTEIQNILQGGLDANVWAGTLLIGALFAIWSGYLLSLAVMEVKGLSEDNARVVAAIPSGIYTLWLIWEGLSWAGVV